MSFPSIQYHPVKSDRQCKPSPTWSHAAHDKWASRQMRALDAIHEIAPPTHWATIKLGRPMPIEDIRKFQLTLSKAIEYQNRHTATVVEILPDLTITTNGRHIALFALPEIDAGACIHFHVLIRAINIEPGKFLTNVIRKHNAKNGTEITVPWIEVPDSVDAVSIYSLKLGNHDTLLFSPGSLSRYTFTAGKYFMDFSVDELREQSLEDWLLTRDELLVDTIVGELPTFKIRELPRDQLTIVGESTNPKFHLEALKCEFSGLKPPKCVPLSTHCHNTS